MAGTNDFFRFSEPKEWHYVVSQYDNVIKEKASKISKPSAKTEMLELDNWYQEDLPTVIQSRTEKYITHEELQKLMKWKLARGKFRPQLMNLIISNKAEDVIKHSTKAFGQVEGQLGAAIQTLSTLRGVGPATASAVLAAGSPDLVPFMADESVLATGETKLDYTLNGYLLYATAVQKCVKRLNKQDPTFTWTCHKVELALWTHHVGNQLKPELVSYDEAGETERQKNGKSVGKRTKAVASEPAKSKKAKTK